MNSDSNSSIWRFERIVYFLTFCFQPSSMFFVSCSSSLSNKTFLFLLFIVDLLLVMPLIFFLKNIPESNYYK
ncbi:hypothetical protein NBO_874g0001 [Nosema bombycis CQ1]|uniref:Uncharacterized protein n=1 Tax=Nosema bombycis (strain CQ1 / CVCC 102059) TaxID=578461 RepID=R0KNM6_NOSB1|nr:hypothetical protein NBO_874g0001 [Nosema bombycis CQ1]|eukprot:EOB11772.1 hypothetical protein NBO_874g0001 [Nosema bombycis CQ1]